tara:strand:- start:285 stop:680 length:396 start_codon:yes stop_codon:yes gene_type:complete
MLRKIEKLRKEPKEVRNRYAFWVALLFTTVVTVFWLTSLPARMQVFTGVAPQEKTAGGFTRMWQSMKASVLDGAPEVVPEPAPEEVKQVTIDEFLASSSQASNNQKEATAPVGRPILIATSSAPVNASSTR